MRHDDSPWQVLGTTRWSTSRHRGKTVLVTYVHFDDVAGLGVSCVDHPACQSSETWQVSCLGMFIAMHLPCAIAGGGARPKPSLRVIAKAGRHSALIRSSWVLGAYAGSGTNAPWTLVH